MPNDFINIDDNGSTSPVMLNATVGYQNLESFYGNLATFYKNLEAFYKNLEAFNNSTKIDSNTRNEDSGSTVAKPDTSSSPKTAEKDRYVRITFNDDDIKYTDEDIRGMLH